MLLEGVVANDQIDLHGESMSIGALKTMVETTNTSWVPMGIEHDPRVPPIGRMLQARLRQEPGGATSVFATMEIFEDTPLGPYEPSARKLVRRALGESVSVTIDRAISGTNGLKPARELAEAFGTPIGSDVKKNVQALAILTLSVGSFIAGGIAAGFLKKIGEDLYDVTKTKVKEVFGKYREENPDSESLFSVRLKVTTVESDVDVEVLVENPTPRDIEEVLDKAPAQLDSLLAETEIMKPEIARVVVVFRDGRVVPRHAIRQDAVPLAFYRLR